MKTVSATVSKPDQGMRLDALVARISNHSRSQTSRWIDKGLVRVNGEVKKPSYKARLGDNLKVIIEDPIPLSANPQDMPLDILYEDEDIIVVNKAAGMVVHPAAGNPDGTLVNALLAHCRDISGIGGVLRPGIVHRLDKGTSGVIVVAKNDLAHRALASQFKGRRVSKTYLALICGMPVRMSGTIDAPVGRHPTDRKKMSTKTRRGRRAVTHWEIVERFGKCASLARIRIETGRTHQIRVHLAANGMPVIGDAVYGGRSAGSNMRDPSVRAALQKAGRPMLHAAEITIAHPGDGREMRFKAPLPRDFQDMLEELREIG